jgi:hypothetical protein
MPRAALVAILLLTAAGPDGPPALPKAAYRRVADIAQLQKHIAACAADSKEARRSGPTAKALAGMLVTYAEALGEDGLKSQAIRVAREIEKKDWKAAGEAAAAIGKVKPDAAVLKGPVPKLTLEEVFAPFRSEKVGGLNIEKDTRDFMNAKKPIDTAAVELLGLRTAVLTRHIPEDQPAEYKLAIAKQKWARYTRAMGDASREVAIEAGKGDKADSNKLKHLLRKLDASCTECHSSINPDR